MKMFLKYLVNWCIYRRTSANNWSDRSAPHSAGQNSNYTWSSPLFNPLTICFAAVALNASSCSVFLFFFYKEDNVKESHLAII